MTHQVLIKMTYIQNGKIKIDNRDLISCNIEVGDECPDPDPKTYPELVQFCYCGRYFIVVVAVDGTVWDITPNAATQIIGLEDIVGISPGIFMRQSLFITKTGNLIMVGIEPDLSLYDLCIHEFASPVVCAEYLYLICSDGSTHKYDRKSKKYNRIMPELHVTQMDTYMPTFLSSDNIVYDSEGVVLSIPKPIIKIYHGLALTENGEVYWLTGPEVKLFGSVPNPKDVVQMSCRWKEMYVVYRNRVLDIYDCQLGLTLIESIPDVDCIDGPIMIQIRPKSASTRNS